MKRKPVCRLSPEEVLRRCREAKRREVCAGQVMAMGCLMDQFEMGVCQLAEAAGVGRQMVADVLAMRRYPTSDWWDHVAGAFGMKLAELDALAESKLRAAMPP